MSFTDNNVALLRTLEQEDNAIVSMPRYASVEDMVKDMKPAAPLHCLHPEALHEAAHLFLDHFAGITHYAVKVNPDPYVLRHLWNAGVRHFDVASLQEVSLVAGLFPSAKMAFMHPVKSREAIRGAYFQYGVRDFAIDTFEELHKILEETEAATDLGIHVRLNVGAGTAKLELSSKFGATPDEAVSLLHDADKVAHRVGICFHVGSQTMESGSFAAAVKLAGEIADKANVELDVLDVGGGFPAFYPGMEHQPMMDFFAAIDKAVSAINLPVSCQIWAEPGRALVASSATLVVRVEMRKGDMLYINDGAYGSLFDARWMNWTYPTRLIRGARKAKKPSKTIKAFGFYGPTCDTLDVMQGPFMLPDDVCEGDWIAIAQHGAYGAAIQTRFNGFRCDEQVEISKLTQIKKRSRKLISVPKIYSEEVV
jgi:ornithine decarboxylase